MLTLFLHNMARTLAEYVWSFVGNWRVVCIILVADVLYEINFNSGLLPLVMATSLLATTCLSSYVVFRSKRGNVALRMYACLTTVVVQEHDYLVR